ncbi:hypothetical protein F4802DRAFT_415757 [Xylaria palmicola]|nr:hypothetical protein F4802DRAFT_415757 [Xylaria palmicola]
MPPKAADSSLESLRALVQSAISLIAQLEDDVHSVAPDKAPDKALAVPSAPSSSHDAADAAASVDALALAHDSASLIKAHTTKLSLLIINEPFTPSAIARVLRELVAGPIPAIASAVQLCTADKYTDVARQDLAWRCHRVLKELRGLVQVIPLDGKILPTNRKNGANGEKGSIVTTGVIWAACDDVMLLKKLGVAGLLVKKAEEYRDTLQDVLEELKEWSEEIDEEDEEDSDDDNDEEEDEDVQHITNGLQNTHVSAAQQMIDDLMTSQRIPRDDPDRIRERLDSCLKRLRLTILLYSAITKRRIKTLPTLPTDEASPVPRRIDEVYPILKRLPHRFGEVACAFYDLDTAAIDSALDSCFFDAFAAAEMLKVPWTGNQDGFTDWADKFQVSIKKPD